MVSIIGLVLIGEDKSDFQDTMFESIKSTPIHAGYENLISKTRFLTGIDAHTVNFDPDALNELGRSLQNSLQPRSSYLG